MDRWANVIFPREAVLLKMKHKCNRSMSDRWTDLQIQYFIREAAVILKMKRKCYRRVSDRRANSIFTKRGSHTENET